MPIMRPANMHHDPLQGVGQRRSEAHVRQFAQDHVLSTPQDMYPSIVTEWLEAKQNPRQSKLTTLFDGEARWRYFCVKGKPFKTKPRTVVASEFWWSTTRNSAGYFLGVFIRRETSDGYVSPLNQMFQTRQTESKIIQQFAMKTRRLVKARCYDAYLERKAFLESRKKESKS